jgi:hypothetical protein
VEIPSREPDKHFGRRKTWNELIENPRALERLQRAIKTSLRRVQEGPANIFGWVLLLTRSFEERALRFHAVAGKQVDGMRVIGYRRWSETKQLSYLLRRGSAFGYALRRGWID